MAKKETYTIQRGSIRTRDAEGGRITLLPGDTIDLTAEEAAPRIASGELVKGKAELVAFGANAVETDKSTSVLKGQLTKAQNALAAEQAEALKLKRTIEIIRAIDEGAVEDAEAQVRDELAAAG